MGNKSSGNEESTSKTTNIVDSNKTSIESPLEKVIKTLGPFGIYSCGTSTLEISINSSQRTYECVYDKTNRSTGYISTLSPINLSNDAKHKAKIPERATSFVWAYQVKDPSEFDPQQYTLPHVKFLCNGGFVYLNDNVVVGVNSVDIPGGDLYFDGPFGYNDHEKIKLLNEEKRFQPVTITALLDKGITRYAWLSTNEKDTNGEVLCLYGGFIYEYKSLDSINYLYFTIKDTSKPVWEWNEKQLWLSYDVKTARLLESKYSSGVERVILNEGLYSRGPYTIDFIKFEQTNNRTGFNRKIRRTYWSDTEGFATWECLVKKSWIPYSNELINLLDNCYKIALSEGDSVVKIKAGILSEHEHEINMESLIQLNTQTGYERPVRRQVDKGGDSKRIPLARRALLLRSRLGMEEVTSEKFTPCYGRLQLFLKKARNLGGNAPFVVITTSFSSLRWQSKIGKSNNAEWNENYSEIISSENLLGHVTFMLYSARTLGFLGKETYLGKLVIPLYDIVRAGNVIDGFRKLDYECKKEDPQPADIDFSITFVPVAKPNTTTTIDSLSTLLTDEIKEHIMMSQGQRKIQHTNSVSWSISHKHIRELNEPDVIDGCHGKYSLGGFVGEGAGGTVKKGECADSKEGVAIKIISKKTMSKDTYEANKREIQILHFVCHKYIISVIESIETELYMFIIMELGTHDLMTELENNIHSEKTARLVSKHLLSALEYLHKAGVCHRDIKPENLLCCQSPHDPEPIWKLTDFGISVFFTESNQWIRGYIGTPDYMAPEVYLQKEYTKEIDLWSSGVTVFAAVAGYIPWNGNLPRQEAIIGCSISWIDIVWNKISQQARDFVTQLLQIDPNKRMSAEEAVRHPWLL